MKTGSKTMAQRGVTPTLESGADDDAVQRALTEHHGDPRATIAALLADCGYLRRELALASKVMSYGFSRGWVPQLDRPRSAQPADGISEDAGNYRRADKG